MCVVQATIDRCPCFFTSKPSTSCQTLFFCACHNTGYVFQGFVFTGHACTCDISRQVIMASNAAGKVGLRHTLSPLQWCLQQGSDPCWLLYAENPKVQHQPQPQTFLVDKGMGCRSWPVDEDCRLWHEPPDHRCKRCSGGKWAASTPSALRNAAHHGVSPLVAAMFRVEAKT